METDKREKSLADQLYEKITAVIGGDHPNQFFCMDLPGTLVSASRYTYDLESGAPKSLHVTTQESILANKLFDACYTGVVDDGIDLQTLHQDAPDIFTPKMNPDRGYAYPVTFNPQNWFAYLDASFTPVDHFTRIVINTKMSEVRQKSQHTFAASEAGDGVSFFLGGCTSDSSYRRAADNALKESVDMEIQIGLSVASVPMEQGVFHPCVPESLVIARDVTIQFYSQSGISASFAKTVEEHSAKGGGFFLFGGNSSSASSPSERSSLVISTANSVTVHFTSPHILGYYREELPAAFPDY